MARSLEQIMGVVRHAARELTGAAGATFVLREGDACFYADEEAIAPLWKGQRFPMGACVSGWVMLHAAAATVEDIYADDRVLQQAYRPTFVKSLAIVPIRSAAPVGAIGTYWAERHRATEGEVKLLRALADLTSLAMENVSLYADLQKQIQQAREAIAARDEFISAASHELRTPLTAMILQLHRVQELVAQNSADEHPKLVKSAARSAAAASRLTALVDVLLDASQLTHAPLRLEKEELDLVSLMREVLGRFAVDAERARCELRLTAPATLRGSWDRSRLQKVLASLLSNAVKYGPGKPVDVIVLEQSGVAHIEVRDRGAGIAQESHAKIFERFGRAGPIQHYPGLGLGLHLARRVIEAHAGTIRFESAQGEGCTFITDLPLDAPGR